MASDRREPPISSGMTGRIASSTAPEDWRVACFGFSAAIFCFKLREAASTASAGNSPCIARSNSARSWRRSHGVSAMPDNRLCRACRLCAMRPEYRPERQRLDGSSPAASRRGDFFRAKRRAWQPLVPCFFGAPKPMIVRQAISEGLSVTASAACVAAAIAAGSCPSTACTCQP